MPIAYVHYDLQDGYVHNWLAGGPQIIPVNKTNKEQIYQSQYQPESRINKKPVEQGTLGDGDFKVGDYEGTWVYTRCQEDHFIQHSQSFTSPHYLRSWAYAQLMSKETQEVVLILTSYGAADLWVNGKHLHRQRATPDDEPFQVSIKTALQAGGNPILVRFEGIAIPDCNHVLALRVCKGEPDKTSQNHQPAPKIRVRLPTTIRGVKRRNFLENLFDAAYLDRDIFGPNDMIYVRWPEDWNIKDDVTVRLQALDGWNYAEATLTTQPGERVFLGHSSQLREGPYRVLFIPKPEELYKDNTRIQREIFIYCSGLCLFSHVPYGTYAERRQEALTFAVRQTENLFAEIAKMELDRWASVEPEVIGRVVNQVKERQTGSPLKLLGLLSMLHRFGSHAQFPQALKAEIEACLLDFFYGQAETGQDILSFTSESDRILLPTCESLAGQLYPKRTFKHSGKKGDWHSKQGEKAALAWMQQRATTGFETWNAPETLEQILAALAALVDLAKAEPVWDMAAALMDKILFSIAVNSFKGVLGAAHKSDQSRYFRASELQPTSGITRLLWGIGSFNHDLAGMVSLALSENYSLPPVLAEIATDGSEEIWSQERHIFPGGEANLVTFKTPDALLASAQDYCPGEKGKHEHIWQASLGKAAVVFTNHPACSSSQNTTTPNFWLGNGSLPRVAQWKDALIAIYNLPEEDWMGFTHAYFPAFAFDEYALRGNWAFAHKDNGYLALTVSAGFQLVRQGHSAYCELRSTGRQVTWLCQVGRAALDGDFNSFQEKVLASEIIFGDLNVQCKTLRGESLWFGWSDPLLRDGKEMPLTGFHHYSNPYTVTDLPCMKMEIRFKDDLLKLDFTGLS